MNIYSYLKKDHLLVSDLMQAVLDTTIPSKRAELFTVIKYELTLHADTEEATFYKAIDEATRSQNVHERIVHADEEHDEIREYIEALSRIPTTDPQWIEQFGEFKHAVEHHVYEEENIIFETARLYLTAGQAVKLANEMDDLKQAQKKHTAAA